jgi:glycosyltransferase involved in cell wall biosynthesis
MNGGPTRTAPPQESPGPPTWHGMQVERRGLVTVIIIFLNAGRFIQEAIDSVLAQTYQAWELLLVDDGSTDESSRIARANAQRHPRDIRYLEHVDHANRGTSASRNLGIRKATGEYIAFLDADDVWLPQKLERQVAVLESHPDVAMVYGLSQWWFSWTGNSADRDLDYVHELGVRPNAIITPPNLLPAFFFRQDAAIPGPSSILIRRWAAVRVGGFEEEFTFSYDDQAFYAKLAVSTRIIASDECLDRYRQHARFAASAEAVRRAYEDRLRFFDWLARFLSTRGAIDWPSRYALRKEKWRCRYHLLLLGAIRMTHAFGRVISLSAHAVRRSLGLLRPGEPLAGRVRFGGLRRLTPISRQFGYDRGQPVDRYYIERFLTDHAEDIKGHVLEVGDDMYSRRFGGERIAASDVLHLVEGNPRATMVGDLRRPGDLPAGTFDCVILTQTLQFIDDAQAALETVRHSLKSGGVVLATLAGIGQVSRYDADNWGYFDSFTTASAQRLFETVFRAEQIFIRCYGNVLSATAFLYGISAQELTTAELDYLDSDYQVIVAVKALKT